MVPQDDMWSRDPLAWAGPNAAKVNLAHQTISFSAQRGWASTMTGSFQMILPPLEAYHHLVFFFPTQVNFLLLERKMLVSLFFAVHFTLVNSYLRPRALCISDHVTSLCGSLSFLLLNKSTNTLCNPFIQFVLWLVWCFFFCICHFVDPLWATLFHGCSCHNMCSLWAWHILYFTPAYIPPPAQTNIIDCFSISECIDEVSKLLAAGGHF